MVTKGGDVVVSLHGAFAAHRFPASVLTGNAAVFAGAPRAAVGVPSRLSWIRWGSRTSTPLPTTRRPTARSERTGSMAPSAIKWMSSLGSDLRCLPGRKGVAYAAKSQKTAHEIRCCEGGEDAKGGTRSTHSRHAGRTHGNPCRGGPAQPAPRV